MGSARREPEPLPWEDEFRRQLIEARERMGISRHELSKRAAEAGLKYHPATMQRVESGERMLRLNEAVVLAELVDLDLEGIIQMRSDRYRRKAFLRGSHEDQARRYGQTVDAARSLFLLQRLARERTSVDPLDDEERGLLEELEGFMQVHTPWVAVLEADHYATGTRYEHPGQPAENRARWRAEQDVLEVLRLVLVEDERLVPEDLTDAPAAVRRWFGVTAAAAAELRAQIGAADVPGLEALASAERAVASAAVDPEGAPESARRPFDVVAVASIDAADVPGLEELASAERAVGQGAGVSRGVDLETD